MNERPVILHLSQKGARLLKEMLEEVQGYSTSEIHAAILRDLDDQIEKPKKRKGKRRGD